MIVRRCELIVFDWDGTLIDSISAIVACTRATLADMGQPPLAEERIRAGIGMGLRAAVENLAPGYDEPFFHRIQEVFRRHWLGTYGRRPRLFEGVPEMLAGLERDGYRMAVATAKGRQGLESDFERTGVGCFFVASRTMGEAPGKPDPGMVRQILDETGHSPEETLVVGDSLHDVGMARNAGVAAIGVATGTEACGALLKAGAIACLARVVELPAWLAGERCRAGGV